ncbi:MAG: hypothetical protein N2559_13880, partial [Anaerolineae bacterium]|nr:hypothetical protein [Anaerolineae bacterium]
YWLRLIRDAGLLSANQLNPLIQEALEIKMILSKTVKTSKERYGKKQSTIVNRQLSIDHCQLIIVSEVLWGASSASF